MWYAPDNGPLRVTAPAAKPRSLGVVQNYEPEPREKLAPDRLAISDIEVL